MQAAHLALLGAASLVLASPAAQAKPDAAGGDACFRTTDIRGQRVVDDRTVYFRTTGNRVFRVAMSSSCLSGARFNDPLEIKSPSGSHMVCRAVDLDVAVRNLPSGIKSPCLVDSIIRLTPAEAAALPREARP